MELRLQQVRRHLPCLFLQGRIAEVVCRQRRVHPCLHAVFQLLRQFPELILIAERMHLVCRNNPGVPIFRNVQQCRRVIVPGRDAQPELPCQPVKIMEIGPQVELLPAHTAVQYASVRELVGSKTHHRPAQLCVRTPQIRFGQLFDAVVRQLRHPFGGQIHLVYPQSFGYFGHVEEAVGQMLQIAVACLHSFRGVREQHHSLFGGHCIHPVSRFGKFRCRSFPSVRFPGNAVPNIIKD